MSLYVGDYLQDTTKLSTEQHGAYLLILMEMWKAGGRLIDTEEELAASARLPVKRWRQVGGMVRAHLMDAGGGFVTQKRLAKEMERVQKLSETRKSVSDLGVMARAIEKRRALAPIGQPNGIELRPKPTLVTTPFGLPTSSPQVQPTLQRELITTTVEGENPEGAAPDGSLATALPEGALREPSSGPTANPDDLSPSQRSLAAFEARRKGLGRVR